MKVISPLRPTCGGYFTKQLPNMGCGPRLAGTEMEMSTKLTLLWLLVAKVEMSTKLPLDFFR